MTANWNDDEIKRTFAEWRKAERGQTPPFDAMYSAAQTGAAARASAPTWRRAALAAAALVVAAAGWLSIETRATHSRSRAAGGTPTVAFSAWRSPTAFLLQGPGDMLVKTVPTVSAGSAELNVLGVHAGNRRSS